MDLSRAAVHYKDVVVVRVANLFLERQLKGYEAQIITGNTLETLGGVVKAPQSLARSQVLTSWRSTLKTLYTHFRNTLARLLASASAPLSFSA